MLFYKDLLEEVYKSSHNEYTDNWDYVRFGEKKNTSKPNSNNVGIKNLIRDFLFSKGYTNLTLVSALIKDSRVEIGKFEYLYNKLEFEEDKNLLVKIVAFRILGNRKVKLPLSSSKFWIEYESVQTMADKSDSIDPQFYNFILYKFTLEAIGYPIQLYFHSMGVYIDFILKQYEYHTNKVLIKAEKDDVVLDGGGCWGDTALYFANEVGENGHVYSFEFIPNNIQIFNKNLSLNPSLKTRITLVPNPLWKDSTTPIYYIDNGPGSTVSFAPISGGSTINTISVDNLVKEENIKKVDFIKLDIEGAELNALEGLKATIIRDKPKLAIALYHSVGEFETIPKFINDLGLGYKFYLGHFTIHEEETILFAKIDD